MNLQSKKVCKLSSLALAMIMAGTYANVVNAQTLENLYQFSENGTLTTEANITGEFTGSKALTFEKLVNIYGTIGYTTISIPGNPVVDNKKFDVQNSTFKDTFSIGQITNIDVGRTNNGIGGNSFIFKGNTVSNKGTLGISSFLIKDAAVKVDLNFEGNNISSSIKGTSAMEFNGNGKSFKKDDNTNSKITIKGGQITASGEADGALKISGYKDIGDVNISDSATISSENGYAIDISNSSLDSLTIANSTIKGNINFDKGTTINHDFSIDKSDFSGAITNYGHIKGDLKLSDNDSKANSGKNITLDNHGNIDGNITIASNGATIVASNYGYLGKWSSDNTVADNDVGHFKIDGNNNNITLNNQKDAYANSTIVSGSGNNILVNNYNPALAYGTVQSPIILIKNGSANNNFTFKNIIVEAAVDNNPTAIVIKDENLDNTSDINLADYIKNSYTVNNVTINKIAENGSFTTSKNIDFSNIINVIDKNGQAVTGDAGLILPDAVDVSGPERDLGFTGYYKKPIFYIQNNPVDSSGGVILQSLGNILFHRSQYIDNIVNNNTMQAFIHRYRSNDTWHMFVNPYYTDSSTDIIGGGKTDYTSKGGIIGAHRAFGHNVLGLFAGYEQTDATAKKNSPIDLNMKSVYAGVKYSGLIKKVDNYLFYNRALTKIASTSADIKRYGQVESTGDIYNLSWTVSAGIGVAYINKDTHSMFLMDVGPSYNGSSTKNFRLYGYADELYHANGLNMYTADISAKWLQDWTQEVKTMVDVGYKHAFNQTIAGFSKIRGEKFYGSFDLPSSYYYGIASVIYHTKSVDYQLAYSRMFDKNSSDNSIFAQVSYAF